MSKIMSNKKCLIQSSSKSLYTSRSTLTLFKKTTDSARYDDSDDQPLQYSLVPLDNQTTPNFNLINEVESAYFDQPPYDTFDKGETCHIRFSEKAKQIAFKRRNSQENSLHISKTAMTPKIEQKNVPHELLIQQIRKVTKIKPYANQSKTTLLQRQSSTGFSLSEILQFSNGSLSNNINANERIHTPVLQLKEGNQLKSILRKSARDLRKRELQRQHQEKVKSYKPVIYNQNTFKDLIKGVKCRDNFRLNPFPPNLCPQTRGWYNEQNYDLFISQELQMDLGWAIMPLSCKKQEHKKNNSSITHPVSHFVSETSSVYQENFNKENICQSSRNPQAKVKKYIQSKKQFCQQTATPPRRKLRNSIQVEKHASFGETVQADQIISQEFDIFHQNLKQIRIISMEENYRSNPSIKESVELNKLNEQISDNYSSKERAIKDFKNLVFGQAYKNLFWSTKKTGEAKIGLARIRQPSLPPSMESSFSSIQLN